MQTGKACTEGNDELSGCLYSRPSQSQAHIANLQSSRLARKKPPFHDTDEVRRHFGRITAGQNNMQTRQHMPPIDIYTKADIVNSTQEHILPAFLGGRLVAREIIDKLTNDAFGHSIDAQLSDSLKFIRLLCDANNSDGQAASPLRGVDTQIGKVNIESGGVVKQIPEVRKFNRVGRALEIDATVSDLETLRSMLKKESRRRGLSVNGLFEKVLPLTTTTKIAMPKITFRVDLYNTECYRSIAKMSCNLFALHYPDAFHSSNFDPIRSFVLDGTNVGCSPVEAVDIDIFDTNIGELDHLVKFATTETGEVLALVVLFGALSFVVRMGRWQALATHSYRVDQINGAHRIDHPADLEFNIPSFEAASERSNEEFAQAIQRQLNKCMSVVAGVQKRIWIRRIIEPHWNHLLQSGNGTEPTSEQWEAFVNNLTDDFISDLMPGIHEASERRRREALAQPGHEIVSDVEQSEKL
ncbi:MAG: hypothetical protein R3B48_13065 [Kofleriaceae bacterium]